MNKFRLFILISSLSMLFSCKDILEEDLEKKEVTILSPENGITTSESPINFIWEKVDGADQYEIEIATPSFSNIRQIILDSIISESKFSIALNPGGYEWRVKALNSAYETAYTSRFITIDSTLDLRNKYIIITHPTTNDTINYAVYQIKWSALYGATNYLIQIFQENDNLYKYKVTTDLSYTDTLIDGHFKVRVMGQNLSSNSQYTERIIVVDQIQPAKPVLTLPLNNYSTTDTIMNFQWSDVTDTGTPITYFLNVYSDSLMQNTTMPEIATPNNHYSVTLTPNSIFWWGVSAKDAAGNTSLFSGLRKLIIE
jgi:hypothetical protein